MGTTELILISFGLAMDCFAVSMSMGVLRKLNMREILRMAIFFGLFQGVMPLVGWFVGSSLRSLIEQVDHWFAFGLLSLIGIKMIWQAIKNEPDREPLDIRKMSVLITLSIATSIDALVTGIGFGFVDVNIIFAVSIIAFITFLVSVVGAKLGHHTNFIPARWAEIAGGIVLITIGLKVLAEHTL